MDACLPIAFHPSRSVSRRPGQRQCAGGKRRLRSARSRATSGRKAAQVAAGTRMRRKTGGRTPTGSAGERSFVSAAVPPGRAIMSKKRQDGGSACGSFCGIVSDSDQKPANWSLPQDSASLRAIRRTERRGQGHGAGRDDADRDAARPRPRGRAPRLMGEGSPGRTSVARHMLHRGLGPAVRRYFGRGFSRRAGRRVVIYFSGNRSASRRSILPAVSRRLRGTP